jgi:hypothetical protein
MFRLGEPLGWKPSYRDKPKR